MAIIDHISINNTSYDIGSSAENVEYDSSASTHTSGSVGEQLAAQSKTIENLLPWYNLEDITTLSALYTKAKSIGKDAIVSLGGDCVSVLTNNDCTVRCAAILRYFSSSALFDYIIFYPLVGIIYEGRASQNTVTGCYKISGTKL